MAVSIAKKLGAHVTGICGSRNKEFVKSLGCDRVICYDASDFNLIENLKSCLESEPHNGQPFDLVLDSVSSNENRDTALNYRDIIHQQGGLVREDDHNYVTFGGATSSWMAAGVRKLTGWNWHS